MVERSRRTTAELGGMIDFLHRAITVDTYTLVVVALLSGWAGVLTLQVLSRTMLAMVFVPGFVLGALVTNYAFELTGFYPTSDRETNVVIACTTGIIIALFALLIVMRFTAVIARLRVEHHRFRHDIKPTPAFAREPRRV